MVWSTSLCHKNMQIMKTIWYHYTPVRMAKVHKADPPPATPVLGKVWSHRNSQSLLIKVQNGAGTGKTVQQFHTKLKTFLPYNPAITPWYLPRGAENTNKNLHTDVYRSFFPTWKQPKRPSVGAWADSSPPLFLGGERNFFFLKHQDIQSLTKLTFKKKKRKNNYFPEPNPLGFHRNLTYLEEGNLQLQPL